MTKKEKIEYALDQWATGTMGLLPALRAIIDALPDEQLLHDWQNYEFPVSGYLGWRCTKCHKMHAEMLSGSGLEKEFCSGRPEPVAEKASEPTSAEEAYGVVTVITHGEGFCCHPNCYKCRSTEDAMREQESEICHYCGAGIGKHRRYGEGTCCMCDPTVGKGEARTLINQDTGEEELIDQQIEEVKADKAKSEDNGGMLGEALYQLGIMQNERDSALIKLEALENYAKELVGYTAPERSPLPKIELYARIVAILGQRSDPPATSPAQPTKDYMDPVKWAAACAQSESDARKLRIIKAMEEMGDGFFSDIRNFKFTPSGWHWIDPRAEMDWQPMEQYLKTRAPEEPLWEGEIVVNDVGDAGYTLPFEPREGWRKIKVRELR